MALAAKHQLHLARFFTVDIVQILLIQIDAAHTTAQQSCQRFQQSRFT